MEGKCPECGADWSNGLTCEQNFHQFGFWELANLERLGTVHHLMVLSYHLQHPSLYSPEGLAGAKSLLVDFVAHHLTPQAIRRRDRKTLGSDTRTWQISATREAHGVYDHPVPWTIRTTDVVAGGTDHYVENVRAWAQSIYEALKASGNL